MYERYAPGTRVHVEFDGTVAASDDAKPSLTKVISDEKHGGYYHHICLYSGQAVTVIKPTPQIGELWQCELSNGGSLSLYRCGNLGAHWVDYNDHMRKDSEVTAVRRIYPAPE